MSFELEIGKVYSLPIFAKNSSEYETLSLRFVWSRVCAFLYSHGPWSEFSCSPSYFLKHSPSCNMVSMPVGIQCVQYPK